MVKLTGLWKGQDKNGRSILSGTVSPGAKLIVLPNAFKKRDTDPDYVAFIANAENPAKPASPALPDTDLF